MNESIKNRALTAIQEWVESSPELEDLFEESLADLPRARRYELIYLRHMFFGEMMVEASRNQLVFARRMLMQLAREKTPSTVQAREEAPQEA